MTKSLSEAEIRLLREIQQDASLSLAELSERCGMAQSTVWRKLQEYEASGLIRARVALLDPFQIGCKLTVIVSLSLTEYSMASVEGFLALVKSHPEIIECAAVSGDADYQLKIRVRDVETFEEFLSSTIKSVPFVRAVSSSFVLKDIKSTTELPLH